MESKSCIVAIRCAVSVGTESLPMDFGMLGRDRHLGDRIFHSYRLASTGSNTST